MSSKRARKFHNAVSQIVETLEKRLMMSTVPLTGTSGNDNFTIAYNPATEQYNFSGGLNTPAPVAASSLTGFTVTGGGASASLTILSGNLTLLNDAGSDGTSLSVTVDSGASLSFNTTEHLASLTVDASATAQVLGTHQILETGGLTLSGSAGAWTGTLDLGNSDMIVHNGNLTTVTSQVGSGYNNGSWNGSGIQSSAAASAPTHLTALGILTNNNGGTPLYSTFDGQTAVTTDLLVKTTLYGDANLDGHVDGSDYSRIDNGYLTHATGWSNGDFNYDGVIDGSDYTLIDNAFNTQPGSPTPAIRLAGSSTVEPGSSYTLDFAVVGNQVPSAYDINWGDGMTSTVAGSATSDTHTYSLAGSYAVSVNAIIGGSEYTSSSFGLDSTFGQAGVATTTSTVNGADAVVQQPDGNTVVLDATDGLLESFNTDGTVNTAFGSEGIANLGLASVAKTLAVDPSGNLLVTGLDTTGDLVVERVTATGVIDGSFGSGGKTLILSSAPSNILTGGASLQVVDLSDNNSAVILAFANSGAFEVARILSDGILDPNAGSGNTGIFTGPNVSLISAANVQTAIAPDGNLLVGGRTATGSVLEQFSKLGNADTMLNGGSPLTVSNSITSLAVSGLGNIFVCTVSSANRAYIDSFQTNGSTGSFGASGVAELPVGSVTGGITSLTVEGNDDLFAVGPSGTGIEAAEYQDNGSLDTTFGSNGLYSIPMATSGYVAAASAVVQSNGQPVIAATIVSGVGSQGTVLRLNATNQIVVQESLTIVPYEQGSSIFAGTAAVLTAEGDALPGDGGALNWTEYRNGQVVETVSAPVDLDGYSYGFSTLNPGQYVVDLAVNGASTSYSFTVLPNPPSVSISGPLSTTPGSVIVVIANATHNPPPPSPDDFDPTVQTGPGDTLSATFTYSWTVSYSGSGSFSLPSGTPTNLQSLYFSTGPAGLYAVTVVVESSDGGGPVTVSRTIDVGGTPTVDLTHVTTPLTNSLSEASSVVVQPADGKIVVAGLTVGSDGSRSIAVVRYNKDLSLDDTFGTGGIAYIPLNTRTFGDFGDYFDQTPILLQPDGKIIVGAFDDPSTSSNGDGNPGYSELFRLNANGTPDDDATTGFGPTHSGMAAIQINTLNLDPINGSSQSIVTTSGTLSMVLLESGDIITAQVIDAGTNDYYYALADFNSGGNLNQSFGSQGVAAINVPGAFGNGINGKTTLSLAVEPNGTYVVGGLISLATHSGFNFSNDQFAMAAFNSSGGIDSAFGSTYPGITVTTFGNNEYDIAAIEKVLTTVVDGVPYIVAAGIENSYDGNGYQFAFAEYNAATGQIVPSFGPNGDGMAEVAPYGTLNELADASILPDGSIVAVGDNNLVRGMQANDFGGSPSTNLDIVKLTPAGLLDTTFNDSGQEVYSVDYTGTETADTTLTAALAINGDDWYIAGGAYTSGSTPTSNFLLLQYTPSIHGATQLTATANPQGTITLNWTSTGGAVDSYGIERSSNESGPYLYIGATAAGVTTFDDESVQPGMTYWYEVYAITATGPQGTSSPATATTPPADEGYQYVETLTISIFGQPVYSNVNLSAGVPYLLVATGNISQTLDGSHRGDAEYGYYPSDGVTNWWLNNPYPGGAYNYEYGIAIGQSATDLNGFYTKYPYWGPLATDSNHTYSVIYTPPSDGPLAANYHDIYYPDNTTGNAGDIALQVAIYRPLPPTPSDLVAKGNTAAHSIDLSWNVPTASWLSGAYSGSETVAIERSSDGGSTFSTVDTVPASQSTWSDNNVLPNKSYIYRVLSQVGTSQSFPSNLATGSLLVNPPQIQPILPQTALRNEPFTLQVLATDPQYELAGLTYNLSASTTGLTISKTGLISGWTPTNAEQGTSYSLTVTVTDSAGVSSSTLFLVSVPVGDSPIQITSGPTIHSAGGNQYSLSVTASEPGIDPSDLFYTWSSQWIGDPDAQAPPLPTYSPQGTTEASDTVATVWAPGAYYFTVTVTDSFGNKATANVSSPEITPVLTSFTITVPQQSLEVSTGSETLSAQGLDQFGNSISVGNVSWNVTSNTSYGSFYNNTALFNAGNTPGAVSVLATASSGASTIDATATIDVSGLSAPSGLTPTDIQPAGFTLNWNGSSGSNLAGYDVRDSLSPTGPFVTALNGMLTTNTSAPISTIPGTTYYFVVVAEDTQGIVSPPSAVLTLPAPQENTALPPPPTNLIANVAAVNYGGITRVALNWDAVTGQFVLGYDVYRSNIPNFVPSASNLIGSSIDNEYVDDSSLTSGSYYYVVETANDLGDSAPSNQAGVNLSGPVLPPTAPTGVTATALSGTSVQVSWTDTSFNETEFLINRSIGSVSGPWTQVGIVPTNVTTFTDTVPSLGTATYYEITAVNTAGSATSAPSSGIQGSTPVATGIVLVPAHNSVQTGGNDQITAEVVDQYGNPLASQPSSFTWSVESGGAGGNVSSSGLYTAPSSLNTVNGVVVNADTVEATADGLTGQVSVLAVVPQAPVVAITSVDSSSGPALLTQDTEIDGIVVDPADGSISYTLTASPEAGGGPITISSGTTAVGAAPNQSGKLGTLMVASMPDGVYSLTLTATDQFNLTSTATVLVQVQSALKLGNLTLPFTDLTIDASGSNPVPVTRTYDSSQASTDTGLGYGWTLNVTDTNLRSTVPPQTGIDEAPGYQDGNLLYVTTPDGVQHTFQFLADPTGDFEDSPLAGLIGQVETYTPQFLCVDGSGAKLILADSDGNDASSNFTLYQDGGRYIDESDTGQNWFNPANPTFGLHYILETANGTQYSVDPSSGQLESVTDANGNTTGYSDGPPYSTTTAPNGKDIASITDTATGQTVQYYYGNDSGNENDLIGFIDPAGNKTTYIYGDQLIVPYNQTATVYAVITRTSDGDVWNTVTNTWAPAGANDHLSLSAVDDSTGTPAWYTATGPAIAPGTVVSIAYFKTGTSTAIYNEARTWSAPHLLTGIISPSGVTVLTATYDPASNELTSLVNTDQQSSGVSTGGFNGTTGDQTVTNAAGDTTEEIFDAYGDVIRKIQTIESGGTVEGYIVTVSSYSRFGSAQAQASFNEDFAEAGVDLLNDPIGEVTYAPFEVTGADPNGLRYSEQPPTPPQEIISYYAWNGIDSSLTDPDLGKLQSEMTLVGPGTTNGDYVYNVTNYSGYSLTSLGNPPTTVQQLGEYAVNSDGAVTLITTIGPSATVSDTYDASGNGNLLTSQNATGVVTKYTYTNSSSGTTAGLLLDTYQSSATAPGGWALLSSNTYYSSTNASIGAVAGLLESTTTYNYEYQGGVQKTLSQTTYDVYDAQGNTLLSYTPQNVGTAASPDWVWNATSNTYNMNGQELSTSQATYTDPASPGSSTDQMNITVTWNTAASSNTTGGVVVNETLNAPVAPIPSSQSSYAPTGQTQTTTDQYGGVTTDTYDAAGNLVDTLYPDGTEVRSVFNALGQVVWQTDRNTTAALNSGANATETLYNSLGQIAGTERFTGVLITLGTDPNADGAPGLEESILVNPTDPGTPISSTATVYNSAGQPVESDSASGLRTGTIYNAAGSVEYTGPLNPLASATWYLSANPLGSFLVNAGTGRGEYMTYLYNLTDASSGNPWSGLTYNATIDADGHSTDTFVDSSGRTIFTVYADGSFTQTIYSVGDQAIAAGAAYLPSGYTPPSVTIPEGGSETIDIAQRKTGDAVDATINVYDSAGNLVDVYQPAVANALNGGATTVPHTHYDYDASGDEVDQIDAAGEATTPTGNTTTWTYDANGNELSRTLPDGEQETFTYNVYGQVATHTDFDGNTAAYTYYSNYSSGAYTGSLEQVVYTAASGSGKANQTVAYTYDSLGREKTVTDASGTTTNFYDNQGNLSEQQTPEGTIWHVFDPTTGDQTETYTNYTETDYGYNVQGQVITATVSKLNGTMLTTPLVTAYTYDGVGNELTETLPDGELTKYGYDALNRLVGMNQSQGATTLFSETLILNDNGSRASSTETQRQTDGTTSTLNYAWGYDADSRLTSESLSATGDAATEDYSDTYSYDLNGNQITDTHTGAGGTAGTTTKTYDGDDQLKTSTINSVETQYAYDLNGSQTSTTVGSTVSATDSYDVRNNMVNATINGVTSSDVYDDNGDRVEETVSGTSTYFLYDGSNPTGYAQVLEAKTSPTAAPSESYVLGLNIVAQANSSGSVSYFLTDDQGSTRGLTNSTGAVSVTFSYDSAGNLLAVTYTPTSPPPTVYLYDQQQFDVALGEYQMRARIYNPATDEFTSFDPMTHAQGDVIGSNPYIFADDDFPNMDDPSGLGSIVNALLGTAVHSFLNRAFEGFTGIAPGFPNVGGAPGPRAPFGPVTNRLFPGIERFSNRRISTIARRYGIVGSTNLLRPDFVEVNRPAAVGDLYELKPLSTFDALLGTSALMVADLALYYSALTISVPTISWSLGRTWAPGLTVWPTFTSPLTPPGSKLVTIDDYAAFPGAIFYDIVGADDLGELAAAAVSGIATVALLSVELSSLGAATSFAVAEAPLVAEAEGADIAGTIGPEILIDTLAA